MLLPFQATSRTVQVYGFQRLGGGHRRQGGRGIAIEVAVGSCGDSRRRQPAGGFSR